MAAGLPLPIAQFFGLSRGRMIPFGVTIGAARLPSDPLFYSAVTLNNIIVGSRYRLSLTSDGTELDKGVAADTTVVTGNLPVYANPQLITLEVRYSSGATKYQPLTLVTHQGRDGASFYVSQVVDAVAT